uniref:hypothetical protein n=1 Tax=Candidatus Saccharicenans sp. TaxID=2819258 RepID=UPI0040495D05
MPITAFLAVMRDRSLALGSFVEGVNDRLLRLAVLCDFDGLEVNKALFRGELVGAGGSGLEAGDLGDLGSAGFSRVDLGRDGDFGRAFFDLVDSGRAVSCRLAWFFGLVDFIDF